MLCAKTILYRWALFQSVCTAHNLIWHCMQVYHKIRIFLLHAGVADVSGLFKQMDIDAAMKDQYLSLLEKFEIALKINDHQMIIPSLMPDQVSYPKPDDILSEDMLEEVAGYYQPPLHRFWLADFVPAGFWPRLICRVATDQHITRVSATISGVSFCIGYMHAFRFNIFLSRCLRLLFRVVLLHL